MSDVDESRRTSTATIASGATVAAHARLEARGAGLCRGDVCVPVRDRDRSGAAHGVDLAELARVLDRPLALDSPSASPCSATSAERRAGDLTLARRRPTSRSPISTAASRRLSDQHGKKRLLVTWGSWCGCREDLPVWQALHEELGPKGFAPITVALDSGPGRRASVHRARRADASRA